MKVLDWADFFTIANDQSRLEDQVSITSSHHWC